MQGDTLRRMRQELQEFFSHPSMPRPGFSIEDFGYALAISCGDYHHFIRAAECTFPVVDTSYIEEGQIAPVSFVNKTGLEIDLFDSKGESLIRMRVLTARDAVSAMFGMLTCTIADEIEQRHAELLTLAKEKLAEEK